MVASLFLVAGVLGSSVTPVVVPGNPTCSSLGYGTYELKVEPVASGTYSGTGGFEVVLDVDAPYIDWTSNYGVNAVVVKGGPNANLYVYSPKSYGDTNLSAPTNPENGMPYGLSHVSFCYDVELQVTKTATTTFTRTWNWTIDKSVTPAEWDLFAGDSGTSQYTVAVTKTGYTDSGWAVSGSISIHNPATIAASVTGVTDVITGYGATAVSCPVTFPYSLAAGATLTCSYGPVTLPNGDSRTNTATATTTGAVAGGSGSAAVTFGAPTTVVNTEIDVDDTNGGSWHFTDSGPVSYTRTFSCDADEGTHSNTATIRQTGQSDSASVEVDCYDLAVTKTANTSLARHWTWDIDKVGDQTALTLSTGQQFLVNYDVTVSAASQDSTWAVNGTISVYNPAPMAAKINGVADTISGVGAVTPSCGVTFPYMLAAGATLDCTYSSALPDATTRTNTATATLQNFSYSYLLAATPAGTTDFSGSASVAFGGATVTETDECITVSDTYAGALGVVCASEAPKTFEYSRYIGPYAECGRYEVPNTASFVTNDTSTTGSDGHTVVVTVPCLGCTLTPGYWKTHSALGPAPYDDTWAEVDFDHDGTFEGSAETFFFSGKTYYQVLWTSSSGGNAYYILARAYIAARLNIEDGASTTTAVDTAMAGALAYFHNAANTGAVAPKGALRTQLLAWAYTLDQYNNGYIGPGHCSE
jgi:hypothetical protein